MKQTEEAGLLAQTALAYGRVGEQRALDEAVENPSIGRIGKPYYDHTNSRVKYFSQELFTDEEAIDRELARCSDLAANHSATRINMRVLCRSGVYSGNTEARIALNNGFTGFDIIYIGVNSTERMSSQEVVEQEDQLVEQAIERGQSPRRDFSEYDISRLRPDDAREEDIARLVDIYRDSFPTYTCKLDEHSISDMVDNAVVYVARHEGDIVSVSVAEIAELDTERGAFKICELSEMATHSDYRGRGLNRETSHHLIDEIRDEVTMIYAESRSCHIAINRVFVNLGFHYAGRANKQCVLSGVSEVSEEGPFENLNVWYVLPRKLEMRNENENKKSTTAYVTESNECSRAT